VNFDRLGREGLLAENRMTRSNERRRIAIVAGEDAEILDIVGPLEVFDSANDFYQVGKHPVYQIEVVSTSDDLAIRTSCGMVIMATATLRNITTPIDTMLIAGGTRAGVDAAAQNEELLRWLQTMSGSVRRLGSVCTGAFILASAGLLRGRRATTHWSMCAELSKRHPDTRVDPDSIFVRDRAVYTSAGVTAGMDLALALVEEDLGPEIAASVARDLVLYLRRPGGQPQLSATLALQAADRHAIRDLQSWIVDHLAGDLSISTLASRVAMSRRNFSRVFSSETGLTPARFVERVRVEAARRRLEESEHTIKQVAAECGFQSADSMRRTFQRLLKQNPSEIRTRS